MSQKKTVLQTVQIKKTTTRHIVKTSKSKTNIFKKEIIQYFDGNGYLSWSSKKQKIHDSWHKCSKKWTCAVSSECKLGELMVIRSPSTRKRFMGCSNYYGGCTASSPLLQKAKTYEQQRVLVRVCKWPMIIFRYSRKQKWTKAMFKL